MATSEYWRVHEEEYRSIAEHCVGDARRNWSALADRCAVMAAQSEHFEALASPPTAPASVSHDAA